jgi:hypothetical protein
MSEFLFVQGDPATYNDAALHYLPCRPDGCETAATIVGYYKWNGGRMPLPPLERKDFPVE